MNTIRCNVLDRLLSIGAILVTAALPAIAQKPAKPASAEGSILFSVLSDGKVIEPIGAIAKGKFIEVDAAADRIEDHFKPGKGYTLIFGGSQDGTVKVIKKATGECAGESADITASPERARLKGFVMALATDGKFALKEPAVRRLPTREERSAAEALVRAALLKQKVAPAAVRTLRYHNLTAIDIDRNGDAEMVGSFWVEPNKNERATLFFIAEKSAAGDLAITYAEFNRYTPKEIMSGEASDLDEGIYHTLLLDYLDLDGDGVGEIVVTSQAFEGRNFGVYQKKAGKWTKMHESYNYRCGY